MQFVIDSSSEYSADFLMCAGECTRTVGLIHRIKKKIINYTIKFKKKLKLCQKPISDLSMVALFPTTNKIEKFHPKIDKNKSLFFKNKGY